jgi:hypothetical protein
MSYGLTRMVSTGGKEIVYIIKNTVVPGNTIKVWFNSFSTLVLDRGEWSASCLQLLYPQGKGIQHPLNRRLGGTFCQSGCLGEGKISCPCWELNYDSLVIQPAALSL